MRIIPLKYSSKWSKEYSEQIERNLGLVSYKDQEKIRTSRIAILGTGGLGGPLAEQLIRTGCENLVICDSDIYTISNLNRQLCTTEDLGKLKVDALDIYLKKINPNAKILKYYDINENNINKMLNGISIVCLTLDDPITSIIIARACYQEKIPLIESFAIPYLFAWWFTQDNILYEDCYGFQTRHLSIHEMISSQDKNFYDNTIFIKKLLKIPGMNKTYNRINGTTDKLLSGDIPARSLAPIVQLNSSYLAINILYAGLLGLKSVILAPRIEGYDYIRNISINLNFLELDSL